MINAMKRTVLNSSEDVVEEPRFLSKNMLEFNNLWEFVEE